MNLKSALSDKLSNIDQQIVEAEEHHEALIAATRPEWRASLRNFIHYTSLRQLDIRNLQLELADLGLSSLGRAEGYVLGNLRKVRHLLTQSGDFQATDLKLKQEKISAELPLTWKESESLLHAHTRAIFGPKPSSRHVYIMVTAPEAEIATETWLRSMLKSGMNILRINAAHESIAEWRLVAERARRAANDAGIPLRIAVDLPGPKLRTVATREGPRVLKLQPKRDEFGRVIQNCRLKICSVCGSNWKLPTLSLPEDTMKQIIVGDSLKFTDTRGRPRIISVTASDAAFNLIGEIDRTAYIGNDTEMTVVSCDGVSKNKFVCNQLAAKPYSVTLTIGEKFALCEINTDASRDYPDLPQLGCTLPEIFAALTPEMVVMIDDGKIMTRVDKVAPTYAILRVEKAAKGCAKLRADMGLNIPDAKLKSSALTDDDLQALAFAEQYADMVGLSFIRSVHDVRTVENCINREDLGLILKIETKGGFEAIPEILCAFLGRRNLALMIARGDLAVEVGFARLAEVQEEILWLAEAAHIPVIWATQVLESLAKTGFPTRSEVTDAAMSVRAECVMLNKGAFIEEALQTLDSILVRMEAHQYKKRQLYRPLKLSLGST